jgi:hypothetical protein
VGTLELYHADQDSPGNYLGQKENEPGSYQTLEYENNYDKKYQVSDDDAFRQSII